MDNYFPQQAVFEDLPDEILISVCRYLSQVNILDSFLNLNKRLNQTIISYCQKIFLSHLSYKDFHHLLNDHLPDLASNVYHLYINSSSMIDVGSRFEAKFNQIDQQFPLLRKLIFHQIDVETLENLSWRFNTMNYLRQLDIDIAEDRLSSMPTQFNEFILGKLFSISNSFESLKLTFNKYQFSLQSIKHKCTNIRHLIIPLKCIEDLLIIFDNFPNIEQLNINIGCSSTYSKNNDKYPYDQLWWKVPYLTKFDFTIREKELISHDNIIPINIIMKITENILLLTHFKFTFDINFSSLLQLTTTKDVYEDTYFPYVNGSLWQQALKRNDNRSIYFELYIELDGLASNYLKRTMEPNMVFIGKSDDVDFNSQLKSTFTSAYWLQKNISVQYFSTASKHISIYTLPTTHFHRSTTVDIIDQEISVNSSPSHSNVQNLIICSNNTDYHSTNLSITNLFSKFPYLIHLEIDTVLLLPPVQTICSYHLRSLSLCNYSLLSCCQLLDYLPKVISLSISNAYCAILETDFCSKPMVSITRLKISIDSVSMKNFTDITRYFPNVNEFHLRINNTSNGPYHDFDSHIEFGEFLQRFMHLRYIEIILPAKQTSFSISNWMYMLDPNETICMKTIEPNSMKLKTWL